MNIKNFIVIWDLDGTLVDSTYLHYISWKIALRMIGIQLSKSKFLNSFGQNNRNSIRDYMGYEPSDDVYNRVSELKEKIFQEKAAQKVNLFPGVIRYLDLFKFSGIKQAMASSAPKRNINIIINALGITHYFEKIVSGSELPSKPHPDIFLKVSQLIHADPHICVVFEDSIAGIEGAKNAGMITVGVGHLVSGKFLDADILLPDYSKDPKTIFEQITKLIG